MLAKSSMLGFCHGINEKRIESSFPLKYQVSYNIGINEKRIESFQKRRRKLYLKHKSINEKRIERLYCLQVEQLVLLVLRINEKRIESAKRNADSSRKPSGYQ